MDCNRVRQQISAGQANGRAVRLHLRACSECRAFRQRLRESEARLAEALPFSAPAELSQRLLAMVPAAAQQLQLRAAAQRRTARPARSVWTRQLLYLLLALGLCLALLFWYLVLGPLQPAVGQAGDLLPALPGALAYWGSQLGSLLAPFYNVLQVLALVTILALGLEYASRTMRSRPAARSGAYHE